jgi:glycosyltransferase involved in cell wall biosynthesis
MTSSTDRRSSTGRARDAFGAGWRSDTERAQAAALPRGRVVVSCSAPFGAGGLGRHVKEIAETLDRAEQPSVCICGSGGEGGERACSRVQIRPRGPRAVLAPLIARAPAWRAWSASVAFDAQAARELPAMDHLIAFNGQAVAQFAAARSARCDSISLVAANSHLRRVVRQHARALRDYPIERSWPAHLLERNLREYAQADRIYVASSYIWESFVEEGHAEESLTRFPLSPDPRYCAPGERELTGGTFDVVYVGSLTVAKGVALLIDAFRGLAHADMRLVLVGGWGTRGMRRFVQRACARDSRISVAPGDPLPHLRRARLFVHPAYEDGFAYAPAEALACGVPVIVSEDTGMKDLIDGQRSGLIVPTGELAALAEAIDAAYSGEIFRG